MTSFPEPLVKKAYYAIGEVCELTGLKPHVLRYWETQFDELRPVKNAAGNRVYRPKEVEFILLLRRLLHEEKRTLQGARQRLRALKGEGELVSEQRRVATPDLLKALRNDLLHLKALLARPLNGGEAPAFAPAPMPHATAPDALDAPDAADAADVPESHPPTQTERDLFSQIDGS